MQRDSEAGRLVGRYMVHRRIAAGGMATVHLGRLIGAAGFSRTVAIKRLHDDYARDPEFVAMLLDEARLTSTIRHPNVVPTLDVVAEQDELLVVMEYVDGESLASLQRLAEAAGERLPVPLAASIVAQALHGLHAAHEARDKRGAPLHIVHRDVSPQNILVGTDGLARVLDFGIAKAASRASATGDGQLKGKTAYMAPEQLQHGAVDRRTDVFAASIVLWELLAGRRLFVADSATQTIERVLSEPIDSPQRWAPEVSTELALVTMRGLERDPGARFESAEEMALAIEDAIALPRAKEISAWVARVASGSISARAEIVREVERDSHPMPAAATTDPDLRAAMDEAERRRQMADSPTDVGRHPAHSSGEVQAQFAMSATPHSQRVAATPSGAFPPPPPPSPEREKPAASGENTTGSATVKSSAEMPAAAPKRASRAPLIAALVGATALAAVLVVLVHQRGGEVDAKAPPAIATGESQLDSDPVPPPPTASVTAASADTTAAPIESPSASPPAKKRYRNRNNGSTKGDCRVPYVVDENGLKRFKPECL